MMTPTVRSSRARVSASESSVTRGETTVSAMYAHWVQSAASRHRDRVALVDVDGEVTYVELAARARTAMAALRSLGVGAGDRVALALPAGVDFVAALHGCW